MRCRLAVCGCSDMEKSTSVGEAELVFEHAPLSWHGGLQRPPAEEPEGGENAGDGLTGAGMRRCVDAAK